MEILIPGFIIAGLIVWFINRVMGWDLTAILFCLVPIGIVGMLLAVLVVNVLMPIFGADRGLALAVCPASVVIGLALALIGKRSPGIYSRVRIDAASFEAHTGRKPGPAGTGTWQESDEWKTGQGDWK